MIKAKQVFFWTSNLKGHGFQADKATIFYFTLKTLFSWNRSSTLNVMAILM